MIHRYASRVLASAFAALTAPFPKRAALAVDRGVLPKPLSIRVIESGHSLTDPIADKLSEMLRAMGADAASVALSTSPGSLMEHRWRTSPEKPMPDARAAIGDYDMLVITERVPLSNTFPSHNSKVEALKWFRHAWRKGNGGAGAETVLYATWVHIDSGPDFDNVYRDPEAHLPWRERLPLEIARWEQIVDYVNARRPKGAPPMRIIPGPQIMAAMDDAVAQGAAPGLTSILELFTDTIHLNDVGAFLIALAHYAVIYGRDPRELPDRIGADGRPELAAFMQDLVWKVVTGYERTGVGSVGSG